MRDDFDSAVADQFKVLDQVPVPDTWSRGQKAQEVPTMIDFETAVPTEPRRPKRPIRVLVAGILAAAAAVAAVTLVVNRDRDESPPVATVPPPPPRALFGTPGEEFVPGTYFVEEVEGTPTPRILLTLGSGWGTVIDGWGIGNDAGFITFSKPDAVFLDACHTFNGYHPGPVTTLDGLVTALHEQGGWIDVTAPSDISVDGYVGQAFQHTAPAEFVNCSTPSEAPFKSWENTDDNGNKGWSYYSPGEVETLWVLDLDGTVIIINTRVGSDQPAAAHAEFAAVLDSIHIDQASPVTMSSAVTPSTGE